MITDITALPTPPTRDDPNNFAARADAFLAALPTFVTELNTAGGQIELAEAAAEDSADAAALSETAAATSAGVAMDLANFYGDWVDLTGALNVPASVTHSSKVWFLLTNLADVTASEPTAISTDWAEFETDYAYLSENQTFTGVNTFSAPIVGSTYSQVSLTGNQTVAGVKTFSSSPIVPAGATGSEVPRAEEASPPGEVRWFARNTAPTGFLKANGALVSRATYANLFAAIGTTFGVGDGSTTFTLPDMRGEFPRGWDDARGIDTGRVFGSYQADATKQSRFEIRRTGSTFSTVEFVTGDAVLSSTSSGYPTLTSGGTGARDVVTIGTGTETRPRNIALLACIKY